MKSLFECSSCPATCLKVWSVKTIIQFFCLLYQLLRNILELKVNLGYEEPKARFPAGGLVASEHVFLFMKQVQILFGYGLAMDNFILQ